MVGLRTFILFHALVTFVSGSLYNLQFEENGSSYNEHILVDKQNGILIYDVPKHGEIQASKYLKDFNLRLNVLKDDVLKTCYVWQMDPNEPSPKRIEEGLKLVNGKFPNDRYLVENDQIYPGRKIDHSILSSTIELFCNGLVTLNITRRSTKDMERIVKEKILRSYTSRTKRATNHFIDEFDICPAYKATMVPELRKCVSCNRADLLDLDCDITYTKYCSYSVRSGIWTAKCKKHHSGGFKCALPSHTRATVKCCRLNCRLSSSCSSTAAPKQG